MSNCNDNKNPLQHNGTSQADRLLPGLQAAYVKVNEKEYADWIVFAVEFASYLNYYDASNKAAGNWQVFFTNDISAILGTIAVQDIDGYRLQIKERFDFIKDDTNAANIAAVKKKLHELFSVLLTMAQALDTYLNRLPENDSESGNSIPLKNTLQNCIETKLAPALQRLIAYHKAATAQLLLVPGDFTGWKVLNTQVVAAETIINGSGLSKSWWRNGAASWNAYITGIGADASIFGNILWTEYRRINHAANHNLFASVFDLFTQNYAKIINEATSSLLITLGNWNTHPAHYALFLAFLKLFRFAQADINTITQRHLDFYYKEVLQLLPKAAEPNKAHILIELAKMTDDYALPQGTELKAGKDSAGKDVLYELDKETVFNKAKVALLKSVYKGDAAKKDNHPLAVSPSFTVLNEERLFASPVINTDDGLGAKLTSANKEWNPYVNKKYGEGKLTDIVSPNAEIGFAIASHFLYLAEGQRKIIIRLATSAASALLLVDKKFDCYLTTEKEWLAVPLENITPVAVGTMSNSLTCAEFIITLGGDVPAITDYNAAVHGGAYNVKLPMVKMILKNFDFEAYQYTALKDIKITMGEVKVEVGDMTTVSQTGLKQLFLAGDFGPLDASKPFQPFGAQPKKDATFIIGNREIFTKLYAKIRLNIEWANLPASSADIAYNTTYDHGSYDSTKGTYPYWDIKPSPHYPLVKPQFLVNGVWKANNTDNSAIADVNIFNGATPGVVVFSSGQTVNGRSLIPYSESYNAYNAVSSKGFMRLVLNGDFGHKKYITDLTTYLIEKSKSDYYVKSIGVEPVEPYSPTIQSLYISYVANTMANFEELNQDYFENARTIQFFHVYPFGEAEQHKYMSGEDVYLFPQFKHQEDTTTVDHIGEFYIGLSDLQPQQAVNILFQVMEGTADPLIIKPPDHIHWSYLSANKWLPFDANTIGDATRHLVQSGIISFVIPADATADNTLLPAGYIWLRAAVSQSAEAICKLISVDAQAALVTFAPNENADDFLEKALPAAIIAKLKTPDASVKKVVQPYSSFGGRP
ncbi:MAG TPA: hypothetical protein VF008_06555, partial [Niastella sp.]